MSSGDLTIRPAAPEEQHLKVDAPRGERRTIGFAVENRSPRAQRVRLATVDAGERSGGAFVLAGDRDPKRGAASWITLPSQSLVLKAGQTETLEARLAVPSGTTPRRYAAAIVASTVGRAKRRPGSITVRTRLGLRLYVNVPANRANGLALDDLRLARLSFRPTPFRRLGVNWGRDVTYAATLRNYSKAASGPLVARLEILDGRSVAGRSAAVSLASVRPGSYRQVRLRAEYSGWSGPFRARMTVTAGGVALVADAALHRRGLSISPLTIAVVIAVIAIVAAIAIAFAVRRRRARSTAGKSE